MKLHPRRSLGILGGFLFFQCVGRYRFKPLQTDDSTGDSVLQATSQKMIVRLSDLKAGLPDAKRICLLFHSSAKHGHLLSIASQQSGGFGQETTILRVIGKNPGGLADITNYRLNSGEMILETESGPMRHLVHYKFTPVSRADELKIRNDLNAGEKPQPSSFSPVLAEGAAKLTQAFASNQAQQ
jgi:hypothetical protein